MEVILLKEVHNLGHPGEVVKVKNGYARNYLIPKQFAVLKTLEAAKKLDEQKAELEQKAKEKRDKYAAVLDQLAELGELEVFAKAGEDEKLFGTVTNAHIAQLLKENHEVELDKKQIVVREHIKSLGTYPVQIQLNKDQKTELLIKVSKEA